MEPNGVGDAPEAQLDAVPILHHLGDVAGDGLLLLPDGGILELVDGLIHLVEHVGHGDGQGILPPHHGGAGVDLEDDLVRPVQVFQGHDEVTA